MQETEHLAVIFIRAMQNFAESFVSKLFQRILILKQ